MSTRDKKPESRRLGFMSRETAALGAVLLLVMTLFCAVRDVKQAENMTVSTMETLKQQCVSFNKLLTTDRIKSLFHLTDLVVDLSEDLQRDPGLVNDRFLERTADELRLNGIAVLNKNLELDASGYSRSYRKTRWENTEWGSRITDVLDHPEKIYAERLELDGQYYDVCAVSRKDAPGIVVGFFHQLSGMITSTERDMESLVSGLHLERNGSYAIALGEMVRASGDGLLLSTPVSENIVLTELNRVEQDGRLHLLRSGNALYLGTRSGCEGYMIYIYYPLGSLFGFTYGTCAVFAAIYVVTQLLMVASRNRALMENQQALMQSNSSLNETVRMLKSLETIYFSLFYADLKEDTCHTIYLPPWLKAVPGNGSYTGLRKYFVENLVIPECRDNVDYRLSAAYIRKMLNRDQVSAVRTSFYTDYQAVRGSRNPWCRVTVTVVDFDAEGNPYHIMALIQDIDVEKRKEADYQAQIMKEALDAKIANNAKSEFLRRISHDIRTPINAVQGYIRMGTDHPEDAALQAICREKASAALNILLDLVNNVLEMSKLENEQIHPEARDFDLEKILEEVDVLIEPMAEQRGISYQCIRNKKLPVTRCVGSPRHLRQILFNLATNAVKYTPAGGQVRLDTQFLSKTDREVSYVFICADNGLGMTEEFQKHMFEPFAQESTNARTSYEGTGLGLAIVKKLVDALGGHISCTSQKDVGTTFRVQLTFRIGTSAPKTEAPANFDTVVKGKRVLLVEDNGLNMEIAEYLLTSHGMQVIKAWNGREAVDVFHQSEVGTIDVILTDVLMPVMSGLEEARAIRALPRQDAKTVPIIAMSANAFEDDIQSSLSAGMNGYVSKPVDEQKLLETIAGLLSNSPRAEKI